MENSFFCHVIKNNTSFLTFNLPLIRLKVLLLLLLLLLFLLLLSLGIFRCSLVFSSGQGEHAGQFDGPYKRIDIQPLS